MLYLFSILVVNAAYIGYIISDAIQNRQPINQLFEKAVKAINEFNYQNQTAKQIVKKNQQLVNLTDKDGNTLLHIAAKNHLIDNEFLNLLYTSSPQQISAVNNNGNTPLHTAAHAKQSEVARFILNKQKDLLDAPNKHGETPLIIAVKSTSRDDTHIYTTALLVHDGASIEHRDHFNKSALDYAKEIGNPKILDCFQLNAPDKINTDAFYQLLSDLLAQIYMTFYPIKHFKIFVRTNDCKILTFPATNYTTVKELKFMLQDKHYHLPKKDYHLLWTAKHALMFAGKHLSDNEKLSKYGVMKESTVHDHFYFGAR
jgi:hypothetical protein